MICEGENLQNLLQGIKKFRQEHFADNKELFEALKYEQAPHTLFVTCSDSRIDPNMLTSTMPGELFIIRNVANIIPPYRETSEYLATTSAIEYAVLALSVKNIIICGHSNCGGCAAAQNPPRDLAKMPHTRKWLELLQPVRKQLAMEDSNTQNLEIRSMEQQNVVEQLKNLLTYSYVQEKVTKGELAISGWYYVIESGEVFIYDAQKEQFILAN